MCKPKKISLENDKSCQKKSSLAMHKHNAMATIWHSRGLLKICIKCQKLGQCINSVTKNRNVNHDYSNIHVKVL